MKRQSILILVFSLLCIVPAKAGYFGMGNSHVLRSGNDGITLHNDHLYYTDSRNTTIISQTTSGNALSVAPGATAFIYIPFGDTLRVQGGPGNGIYPGGAAIRVPKNSVLYVVGGGTLIAKGGAAGLGSQGLDGTEGKIEDDFIWAGNGGAGGNGGGGAGAGIGGNGGRGGRGGAGVTFQKIKRDDFYDQSDNGVQGKDGDNSDSGEDCGMLYFVGGLDVNGFSGDVSAEIKASAMGYSSDKERGEGIFDNDISVGGGGGGGNGNNGLEAEGIGGGGPGAAGAGAGSTGACANYYRFDGSSIMKYALQKITQVAVDALVAYLAKDKDAAKAIVFTIPGTDYKLSVTAGDITSEIVGKLLQFDFSPVQINGGGGFGSDKDLAPAERVSGIGFYTGPWSLIGLFDSGTMVQVHPNGGGNGGQFGKTGARTGAMRTSQVRSNVNMDELTEDKMPEKLKKALTFDMKFDNTGVDMRKPHQHDVRILYSTNLPDVTVPSPRKAVQFKGYCDETGRFWYDEKGKPLVTAKGFKGEDLKIYVHPGDITLYPQWSSYYTLVVRHWQETTEPKTNYEDGKIDTTRYFVKDYKIYMIESDAGKSFAKKTVTCRNYRNFDLRGHDKNKTVTMTDTKKTYTVDFFYDRRSFYLGWAVPDGTEILDSNYTKPAMIPFGKKITAPKYALNKSNGIYHTLNGWKAIGRNGQSTELSDTMPAHNIVYEAVMNPVTVAMSFINDDRYGTCQEPKSRNLGQQILFNVTPKKGYEVDTCYATIYSPFGTRVEKTIQTQQGQVIPGTLDMDSISVEICYRGSAHKLDYKESTDYRQGYLTMFIDGDSVYHGNTPTPLTVRHGNKVWLRAEPNLASPEYVCRNIVVKTVSGNVVPVKYEEEYDCKDHCQYYWSFTAPDEDIEAVAAYGTLSENQIKTTVEISNPDSCTFNAYCNRGEKLDNKYLFDTKEGYLLEPGQILWFEATPKNVIDSVVVVVDEDQSYPVQLNGCLFLHRDALDTDTTKAPQVILRYALMLPSSAKKSVQIKINNGKNRGETSAINATEASEARDPRTDGRYYDTFGNCWGSDAEHIPAGIYIHNGKKFTKIQ